MVFGVLRRYEGSVTATQLAVIRPLRILYSHGSCTILFLVLYLLRIQHLRRVIHARLIVIIIVSALALFLLFIEYYHLMGSILRYNLFENAAARFLLGAVHVPINRILIPLFIRAYLLRAVRLLLFEDWRVIDKAHRATIGGDHGGLVHVVCGHLLLHKLESVSRNSV